MSLGMRQLEIGDHQITSAAPSRPSSREWRISSLPGNKKTHKRKERLLKWRRGARRISRDNGGKGVGSEREKREEEDWGIGRRVRREWWGYLVPVLPVLNCLLDLVPYTCCTWPTAKILCVVLKTPMKSLKCSIQPSFSSSLQSTDCFFLFRFSRVFPI